MVLTLTFLFPIFEPEVLVREIETCFYQIIYNTTSSLARFENKNIIFYFEKRSSLLQRWCCCKFKSRRIGCWSQSHDRELQRQRMKNLQLHD
jgi:hypothetical protein